MQSDMDKLYEKLVEYKVAEEFLDYIDELDDLIAEKNYNKKKVIEIENKYALETKFLLDFEDVGNIGFQKNYEDADLQVLVNLRDRLYYIAVLKILEEKKLEIPKNLPKRNFKQLLELL